MIDLKYLRPTRAVVNLDNLVHNLREIKKIIPDNVKVTGVIKANAYGHGAIKIAEVLMEEGIDYLGVATLSEAIEIKNHFPDAPVFIMGYTPDTQLPLIVEKGITCTIFSLEQAKILSEEGLKRNKKVKVHIKVDTGFHRLGMAPSYENALIIKEISILKKINIEGIFSHLALKNEEEDIKQFNLFMNFVAMLEEEGIRIPIKHICDSIGAAVYKNFLLDMIRPGATLYGYISRKTPMKLKPVMTLETKVSHIMEIGKGEGVSYDYTFVAERKTKVATLPIGYADGLPRMLSNNGYLYIHGRKANIIGKVCMDQCMVDITDIEGVQVGDVATLYGYHGEDIVSLTDIANLANTNRNEILALVPRRVPRVYIKNGRIEEVVDYLME